MSTTWSRAKPQGKRDEKEAFSASEKPGIESLPVVPGATTTFSSLRWGHGAHAALSESTPESSKNKNKPTALLASLPPPPMSCMRGEAVEGF